MILRLVMKAGVYTVFTLSRDLHGLFYLILYQHHKLKGIVTTNWQIIEGLGDATEGKTLGFEIITQKFLEEILKAEEV